MPKFAGDVRSLARTHTESCIRSLAAIAAQGESDAARTAACIALLDRGWGKPAQTHTGEDGEGAISITIRHIMEGTNVPVRTVPTIEPRDTGDAPKLNGNKDF